MFLPLARATGSVSFHLRQFAPDVTRRKPVDTFLVHAKVYIPSKHPTGVPNVDA